MRPTLPTSGGLARALARPRPFALLLLLALAGDAIAAPPTTKPAPTRTVDAPRLTIRDVVPSAPADVGDVDLGPSPPPGADRLVARSEILAALASGAVPEGLRVPVTTRVVRATTRLSPAEIQDLVRKAAPGTLPKGAELAAIRPRGQALVPRGFDEVELTIPRPPRKKGRHAVVATLRLQQAGTTVAGIAVPLDLELAAAAMVPDIRKGSPMVLMISSATLDIQALVTANADADVGDVLPVTVEGSGKLLRARLVQASPPRATVEP